MFRSSGIRKSPTTQESRLVKGLLTFMSTKINLNQIFSALVYHKARGIGRLLGLQYFLTLISTLQSQSLLSEVLLHLSLALRQPNRDVPMVKEPPKGQVKITVEPSPSTAKFHFLYRLERCVCKGM